MRCSNPEAGDTMFPGLTTLSTTKWQIDAIDALFYCVVEEAGPGGVVPAPVK